MKDITHYFTLSANSSSASKSNGDAKLESKNSTGNTKQEKTKKLSLKKHKDEEKKEAKEPSNPSKRRGRQPKASPVNSPKTGDDDTPIHKGKTKNEHGINKAANSGEGCLDLEILPLETNEDKNQDDNLKDTGNSVEIIVDCPISDEDIIDVEKIEMVVNSNARHKLNIETVNEASVDKVNGECNFKTDVTVTEKTAKRKRIRMISDSSDEEIDVVGNTKEQKRESVEIKSPIISKHRVQMNQSMNKLKKFKFEKHDKINDKHSNETNGKIEVGSSLKNVDITQKKEDVLNSNSDKSNETEESSKSDQTEIEAVNSESDGIKLNKLDCEKQEKKDEEVKSANSCEKSCMKTTPRAKSKEISNDTQKTPKSVIKPEEEQQSTITSKKSPSKINLSDTSDENKSKTDKSDEAAVKSPNAFQLMMSGGAKKCSPQLNEDKESSGSAASSKKQKKLSLKNSKSESESGENKSKTLSSEKSKPRKRKKSSDRTDEDKTEKLAEKELVGDTQELDESMQKESKGKNRGSERCSEPKTEGSHDEISVSESKSKSNKSQEKTEKRKSKKISSDDLEDDDFKEDRPKGKRKHNKNSDDENDDSLQIKIKPSGLYSYFSPVSRDEAMKKSRDIPVTKTVAADVHHVPSPEDGRKHSLGPTRRSQRSSVQQEDDIVVMNEKPRKQPNSKSKFKTPEKKPKRRRPWSMKIRLLSPAKPLPNDETSSCTDSDSDWSVNSCSPFKPPSNKKNLPLASIFLPKNRNATPSASAIAKVSRKITMSMPLPSIRPEKTEHTIGFADVDPSTPMCVLYPLISHITQLENSKKSQIEEEKSPLIQENTTDFTPNCPPIECGLLINILQPQQSSSSSYNIPHSSNTQELWTDIYRPKSAGEVAGNSKSVQELRLWLDGWKQRSKLSEEHSQNSCDSESSDYSSGDDFIVSDNEDSDDDRRAKGKKKKKKHINTAILVGPCGSGKTATVYAVADELGFKVLEMNASSRRSGKRILSELQEATQSHQVRNTSELEYVSTFLSSSTKVKEQPKDRIIESQQSGNGSGLSLILVEDVDVVFEEQDEGFIAALNTLAASSKRPLILVSNDPQCSLLLARHHRLHLDFTKVPSASAGVVVKKLWESESQTLEPNQISCLLQECNDDLRRAVLLSQTLVMSGGFPKTINNCLPYPLDLLYVWRGMSRIPLPFIISDADMEDDNAPEPQIADKTWESFHDDDDDDEVFPLPKKKQFVKQRQRLTSDSLDDCDASNSANWPSDLAKTQWLTHLLSTLDIIQCCGAKKTRERPGLSDQHCLDGVVSNVGTELQHWLASKALAYSKCHVARKSSEEMDRWNEIHHQVDKDLLEQLPLTSQLDHGAASLDLLPALRGFGRLEQLSARPSRRSRLNALQGMGFTPTPLTLESLVFVLPDSELS